MELVGRTVRKEFLGLGTVQSFDSTSGLFEIVYDGGDSEEMNIDEVMSALDGGGAEGPDGGVEPAVRRRGRPPKRLRRGGSGESVGDLVKDCCIREGLKGTVVRNLETLDVKCGLSEGLVGNGEGDGKARERVWREGLDLNVSVCEDDDLEKDGFDGSWNGDCKGSDSGGLVGEARKIKHSFDVNVSVHEESEETQMSKVSGIGGDVRGDDSFETVKQSSDFGSVVCHGSLEDAGYGVNGGSRLKAAGFYSESDTRLGTVDDEIKNEARDCNEGLSGGASRVYEDTDVKDSTQLDMSTSDMVDAENCGGISNSEPSYKEEQVCRKRRRQSGSSKSTPQPALRRSSRRLSSVSSSANHISSTEKVTGNAGSSSPEIISASDAKSFGPRIEVVRKHTGLPPKLELPASSKNLNIDETSVLDIFSIYACLRSFSTVLFLSPFDLKAFVEAVKDSAPNSLIDSIHFSLLQILKLHLEFLSNEGSEFASNCLRSLNWGFLDPVTWPLFMVEYLLISGSGSKPGFEKINLKFLIHNYYSQHPSVKIKILCCLCDDFLEAEAVRLELSKRTAASELDTDLDRNTNVEHSKKRKDYIDDGVGSCLTQEIVDEANDWNSDECCLCKMDGILICCDGCPAAYHTKCVGTAKELLPEGDWYCPECVMNRYNCWMKSPRALRGAELLGTDSYGRIYFNTCGYLLVLDSCDPDSSLYYYKRDDLDTVIEVLKSFNILYDGIIKAICSNWNIPVDSNGAKSYLASQIKFLSRDLNVDAHKSLSSLNMKPSEENEVKDVDKPDETFVVSENVDSQLCEVFELADRYDSTTMNQPVEKEIHIGKCEGSTEIMESVEDPKFCERKGPETLNGADSDCKRKEKSEPVASGQISAIIDPDTGAAGKVQSDPSCYVNCYTFAQTAACVAQELIHKSPNNGKEDSKRSAEDIISGQMKVVSKRSTRFRWPNFQSLDNDVQKENCGWCFSCRTSSESGESGDCVFHMIDKKPASESITAGPVDSLSKRNSKSHLCSVVCYILSIEERLSGLLSGPWKDPQYSKKWRRSILKATDVASVKHLLLILESNLRRIALSQEWLKPVDSAIIMGSASHVWTISEHASSSRHGVGRKRARFSDLDSTSSAAARSSVWWRGGRVSRLLFHWKILPYSLAFKGGRQAGCRKILGMLYPDGSEFAKRSRFIAWRAAVEMSTSTAELAFQVREFDSFIRWDDLENTQHFSHLSKESRKSMKLFKKVVIRRKCTEGTYVKYLLDFGKRKIIPDTVVRNGMMLEVSASERKKYWLEESLVPLHILKSYEEKKLSRISTASKSGLLDEIHERTKSSSSKKGLEYLLARSEKSDYQQCGHCKKDVLVSDAVNCQDCGGFFHKRHVKKSESANSAGFTCICHKCQDKKSAKKPVKGKSKKGKTRPKKGNRPPIIERPKRLAAMKVKYVSVRSKKRGVKKGNAKVKKGKRSQPKNVQPKKSKKEVSLCKGKRSQVYHTYWSNGLQLTRKPDDARVTNFAEKKLLLPSRQTSSGQIKPTCSLCSEVGHNPRVIYANCELCGDWFHGGAFGITLENCGNLLGFRCFNCCQRKPPLCTYSEDITGNSIESLLAEDRIPAKDVSTIDGITSKSIIEQEFSVDVGSSVLLSGNVSGQNMQMLDVKTDLGNNEEQQERSSIADTIEQEEHANAEKCIYPIHFEQNENYIPDSMSNGMMKTDMTDSNGARCENGFAKDVTSIDKEQKDIVILGHMQECLGVSIRDSNHILVLDEHEIE